MQSFSRENNPTVNFLKIGTRTQRTRSSDALAHHEFEPAGSNSLLSVSWWRDAPYYFSSAYYACSLVLTAFVNWFCGIWSVSIRENCIQLRSIRRKLTHRLWMPYITVIVEVSAFHIFVIILAYFIIDFSTSSLLKLHMCNYFFFVAKTVAVYSLIRTKLWWQSSYERQLE